MTKNLYFKIKGIYGDVVMEIKLDFNDLRLIEKICNDLTQRTEVDYDSIKKFTQLKEKVLSFLNEVQYQAYKYEKELENLTTVHAPADLTPKRFNSKITEDFFDERLNLGTMNGIPVGVIRK